MTDYLFIGDIHSQNKPLEKALAYALEQSLIPVMLGDVFDSRTNTDETLEVFQTLWEFPEDHGFLMVQSNHQWKLLQYYNQKRKLGKDFTATATALLPYRRMVQKWLSSLPLGVTLRDSDGIVYKVSHAQFPSKFRGEMITTCNSNSKQRGLCLFGSTRGGERVEWWDKESERDWVRVAGHYHTVHIDSKSLVLDGGCGSPGGYLVAYDTKKKDLFYWDV